MADIIPEVPVEPKGNPTEDRIRQLSDKVEIASKERDESKSREEMATRERDFYKGFSEVLSTNPLAKDHEAEIREKVLKGYSVQDATFAALGAAGKFSAPIAPPSPAGGSADTAMPSKSEKEVKDMTQVERRAELEKVLVWS